MVRHYTLIFSLIYLMSPNGYITAVAVNSNKDLFKQVFWKFLLNEIMFNKYTS